MLGEKQSLTVEEFRALAELGQHVGFNLLCEVVQADIDDLANALATAATDEEEKRKLTEWRALRSLLGVLQAMPDWANEQVQALADAGDMESQALLGQEMTPGEAASIYDQFVVDKNVPGPSTFNWGKPLPLEGMEED